ncbi:hypothetical protein [Rhabdochlamydiaceae symbiont of Dictyostelium giganteum]|uniref:hypothetical protein n=1 Tax=Rhabdochlamydiaceae symbiont of Dictyostelium giganteum TaxID=3342349 RepID=UPI00384AE0B7
MIDIQRCSYDPQGKTQLKDLTSEELSLLKKEGQYDITSHVACIAKEIFKDQITPRYRLSLNRYEVTLQNLDSQKSKESITLRYTEGKWKLYTDGKETDLLQESQLSSHIQQTLQKVRLAWSTCKKSSPVKEEAPATPPLKENSLVQEQVKALSSDITQLTQKINAYSSLEHSLQSRSDLKESIKKLSSLIQSSSKLFMHSSSLSKDLTSSLEQLQKLVSLIFSTINEEEKIRHNPSDPHLQEIDVNQVSIPPSSLEDEASLELDIHQEESILPSSLNTPSLQTASHPHSELASSTTAIKTYSHLGQEEDLYLKLQQEKKELEITIQTLKATLQNLSQGFYGVKDQYLHLEKVANCQTEELKTLHRDYHATLKLSQDIKTAYASQLELQEKKIQELEEGLLQKNSTSPPIQQAPLSPPATSLQPLLEEKPVSSSPKTIDETLKSLEAFGQGLQQLAEGKLLKKNIAGSALTNLAYLDPKFPEKYSELDYRTWIQKKIATSLDDVSLKAYIQSLKVHLQKHQKNPSSPKITFPTIEKLSGYLSQVLQDQEFTAYLADLNSSTGAIDPGSILGKYTFLSPKISQLRTNLSFISKQYQAFISKKTAMQPKTMMKFENAEKLNQYLGILLKNMLKSLNQTDWRIE